MDEKVHKIIAGITTIDDSYLATLVEMLAKSDETAVALIVGAEAGVRVDFARTADADEVSHYLKGIDETLARLGAWDPVL